MPVHPLAWRLSVLFCLFWVGGSWAQVPVSVDDAGVKRDTLDVTTPQPFRLLTFILPGSERIYLNVDTLDVSQYRLDYRHGFLWIPDSTFSKDDMLVVSYRTLPFRFQDVYQRNEIVLETPGDPEERVAEAGVIGEAPEEFDLFENDKLTRTGSITRGILAGSNRDVTIESGLRMELSGEIVNGVQVQAVLTDENTPILPEGTTQRLQEFDRVYIQIQAPLGTAQLGDFDLQLQGSEFARLSRKLQGFSVAGDISGRPSGRVTAAGATARGIFRSQTIDPIDGIQGPYRLEGGSGERFILIVPGSETVYLDGQRLTRGETEDYVIDYATAEITFTPQRLVTADQRIKVEFQYATNQFTRTLVALESEANLLVRSDGSPRAQIGATLIREADSRHFSEELGFTSVDSLALSQVGDGIAVTSGAEEVVFDPEALYTQYVLETRVRPDGIFDTVYVAIDRRPADTTHVYRVRFSRIGPGKGSYTRLGRSVNGVVYEYVGPGRGEYDPVRVLPKPKRQQLFDIRGRFEPVRGLEITGEWAYSLDDKNRLSTFDKENDLDNAYRIGLQANAIPIVLGNADLGHLSGTLQRRFIGEYFISFDRIRPVEFERQWNLNERSVDVVTGSLEGGDEQIDEANMQLALSPTTSIEGEAGRIELGSWFFGQRQSGSFTVNEPSIPRVDYRIEHISSRDSLTFERGRWVRQLGSVQHNLLDGRLAPRFEVEHENRRQGYLDSDSLSRRSFAFVEYRPSISWMNESLEAGASFEWRKEDLWADGSLQDAATAWTTQTHFSYRTGPEFSTDASLGYRIKRYTDYFRTQMSQENAESVVMRWDSRVQPFQRALRVNWHYEALTEKTPTLQEIYVRTGPELGQYVWEDHNEDGVIQVDEFLPERLTNEGTYVKTFLPSDTLTSVINVQARLRIEFEPVRIWRNVSSGWKKWLSYVMTRTTIDVQEKSRDPELAQIYLLNLRRYRDSENTVNGRLRLGQEVFLFRTVPDYGLDIFFNQARNLSDLAAGEESRFFNTWRAEGRYRLSDKWSFMANAVAETNRVASESFASRRYDIKRLMIQPEGVFQPSRFVRMTAGCAISKNTDRQKSLNAHILMLPVEWRYMKAGKFQLTARAEWARVLLDGDISGLARFELTEGRGKGNSVLWRIGGNYVLNTYLRCSLSYDGRAAAGAPVLHTLQLQLSALF